MPKKLEKYITVDSSILGGTPVIFGTRIPIIRLSELMRQGYTTTTLEEEFPQLKPKVIQDLMAYLLEMGLDAFTKYEKER